MTLEQTTKAQTGSKSCRSNLHLTSVLDGGWVVNTTPQKETRYHCTKSYVGKHSRFARIRIRFTSLGIDQWTVQLRSEPLYGRRHSGPLSATSVFICYDFSKQTFVALKNAERYWFLFTAKLNVAEHIQFAVSVIHMQNRILTAAVYNSE